MLCREASIRASTDYGEVIAPIKCRSWGCDYCAPERQAQLQSTCINGRPNRFITITCRYGEFGTKELAAAAIVKAWQQVVLEWRRQNKWHKCQYICVFEETKRGWPHLHILWRGHWISGTWLSTRMDTLLNSPRVDIQRLKSIKQSAFYVAKYFTKAPIRFGTCKRYWKTQSYGKPYSTDAAPAFPKGVPVSHVPTNYQDLLKDWYREGRNVWTIRNRIFGWGFLVNSETGEIFERPSEAIPHEWGVAWDD